MWYVGVDVHLRSSSVCVLDGQGQRIRQKTIRGPWPEVVAWLAELTDPISVCYEASCGYGPLYEALSKFVSRVEVAHPGHLRLIFRSKRKNDRVDAQKLAKLLYLDEVPTVHVPSAEIRAWRGLIEHRARSCEGGRASRTGSGRCSGPAGSSLLPVSGPKRGNGG